MVCESSYFYHDSHFYTPQQPELFRFTEGMLHPPVRGGANV